MTDLQAHTPHIEEVCSAYVQYHHFNSYGMDDSEETEKGFYRMIAQIQREAKVQALRLAATDRNLHHLGDDLSDEALEEAVRIINWLQDRADWLEGDDE